MTMVPGWTSMANIGGAYGLIEQTPGYINMQTLTPEGGTGGGLPVINAVTDIGANPDGNYTNPATDSTTALMETIAAAAESTTTSIAYVPPGTYLLGTSGSALVENAADNGVWLMGSGAGGRTGSTAKTIFLGASGYDGPLLTLESSSGAGGQAFGMRVSDIFFTSAAATPAATGILAIGCSFNNYDRLTFGAYPALTGTGLLTCISSLNNGTGVAAHNHFTDLSLNVPAQYVNNATGISMTATNTTVGDVHQDVFFHTAVNFNCGSVTDPTKTANGIYFGACDHIFFFDLYNEGGNTANTTPGTTGPVLNCTMWDWTNVGTATWPADCTIIVGEFNANQNLIAAASTGTISPGGHSLLYDSNKIAFVGTDNGVVANSSIGGLVAPWNEPNQKHVWQAGQVSPTQYGNNFCILSGASPWKLVNNNAHAVMAYVSNIEAGANPVTVNGYEDPFSNAGQIGYVGINQTGTFRIAPGRSITIAGAGSAPQVCFTYATAEF